MIFAYIIIENKKGGTIMDKKNKLSFVGAFSLASVWFGAHVGGGFASGSQTMSFFIRYGRYASLFAVISMALVGLTYRENMIMARHYRAYDYHSFGKALFEPYNKVLSPVYDICYIMAGLLAVSASIAGAAALLTDIFKISYFFSVAIIGILTLLMSMFGSQIVSRASSVLTILIVVSFFIICIEGISLGSEMLKINLAQPVETTTLWKGAIKALSYAGFQCFAFLGLLGATSLTVDDKDCTTVTGIGFVLNAVMIALTVFLIQAFMPAVAKETLPILAASKLTGKTYLIIAYSIALFCAFLSTAVAVVYGNITLFTRMAVEKGSNLANRKKILSSIIGVIIIVISMLVSSFGLTKIIAVGYSYFGYIGIFLVIIPSLTYGHYRNKKFKEKSN